MSSQTIIHSTFDSCITSSASEEKLVQQDDPLLGYMPNIKDLRCNKIDSDIIEVRLAFLNEIRDIGNVTSDLSVLALSEGASVVQNNPNSATFALQTLRASVLSNSNSTTCVVNDPSGTKVFDVSGYLRTKDIGKLLSQEPPKNQQRLIAASRKFLLTSIALIIARHQHYPDHKTEIKTCNKQVTAFEDLVCRSWLSNAKTRITGIDFTQTTGDLISASYVIVEDAEPDIKVWHANKSIVRTRRLQNRHTTQCIKKDLQQLYDHLSLTETFITLLTAPQAISQLLSFTAATEGEENEFYASIQQLVTEHQTKKADAAAEALLKELEEEKKKTSRKKRPPPKKSTKSLKQASATLPSQSSSVVEKQPLLDQAARPKEKAQTSPELDMLAKIHQGVKKTLSLHERIKRWSKATPETIHQIKDWSEETKQWIYPYTMDPDPESTIARHNLSFLVSILRSNIGPFYSTSYSFKDTDNYLRSGKALVADMERNGIEQSGTIFVGIGTDDVLYHAYFTPFDLPSPKGIANVVRNQIEQMAHIDKAIVEAPREAKNTWKTPGIFSVKKEPEEGKLLLIMENKNIKFTFYPLT